MLTAERRQEILSRLQRDGKVVASELVVELGVSEDTVRRDLRELAAAVQVLRKNTAAQIKSNTEPVTCRPMSTSRARLGRLPLTTSPWIVRTTSRRVAVTAGISAKNNVETAAATIRNNAIRQSAGGISRLMSPSSGGKVLPTP